MEVCIRSQLSQLVAPVGGTRRSHLRRHQTEATFLLIMSSLKRALSPTAANETEERPSKISSSEVPLVAPVSSLLVKRVSERGRLPTRGSALAAGYDLYRYDEI